MKKFYLIIFILFLGCNLNSNKEVHGIKNLKLKLNSLVTNKTNQNDISNIIGPPMINYYYDKNIWIYFEVVEEVNIFGNKKIILDDSLVLKFNTKGVLTNYEYYDLNSSKKLEFNKNYTRSYAMDEDLFKSVLSTSKRRWDMTRDRFGKKE